MIGSWLGLLLGLVGSTANAFLLPVQSSMLARASRNVWCKAEGNSLYDGKELVEGTIYVLYKPAEGDPWHDIVFFHGLQLGDFANAWKATWESELEGRQKICWPAEFLGKDFPRARVLSVSYDASAKQGPRAGCSDLETIGQKLATHLVGENVGVGTRPVVLVGHSLGGLVLKKVCLKIDETSRSNDRSRKDLAEAFLRNVKGMVFYATPHGGSKLADLARWLPSPVAIPGPVVSNLEVLNTGTWRLNTAFNLLRSQHNWATLGFKENHRTAWGFFHDIVVPEASADRDMDECHSIDQDHIQICKPKSVISPAYELLKSFLHKQLDAFKRRDLEVKLLGRGKELEEVCSALNDSKVVLIVGGPGEGKTSLAKEAARKFRSPHWHTINHLPKKMWSDEAEARGDLGRTLLEKLEPEVPCPKGVAAWDTLLKKVEMRKGAPKGFIYDGMEALMSGGSAEVFDELVSHLAGHGVQQIITSRMCPKPVSQQYTIVRLPLLSKDDAIEILRGSRSTSILKPADADRIVDVCKGNPYLLNQVGHLVAEDIDDVAKDSRESGSWPDLTKINTFLSKYNESLSDYLSENGKRLLRVMSLWHSFTDNDVPGDLEKELQTLEDHSVLYKNKNDSRYEMHVIPQEAAVLGMSEQVREQAAERFLKAMTTLAKQLKGHFDNCRRAEAEALASKEAPNCRRFCAISHLIKITKLTEDQRLDLRYLAHALEQVGHHPAALCVRRYIHDHVTRQKDVEDDMKIVRSSCQMELASSLGETGDYEEAEQKCREALIGFESLGCHLHLGKLICYYMLSSFLVAQGRYPEARHYSTTAMDIERLPRLLRKFIHAQKLEEWKLNVATIMLMEAKYDDVVERLGGVDRFLDGTSGADKATRVLVWALRGQQNESHAARLYEQMEERVTNPRPVEDLGRIREMLDLAWWRLCQGEYAWAGDLGHRARTAACSNGLQEDHVLTLTSHVMELLSLRGQDRDKGKLSERMLRDVVEPARKRRGRQHPDTLLFIGILNWFLRGESKHHVAEALHREGLAELRFSVRSMQWYLDEQRKYMQAELELRTKELGENHRSTLSSRSNLAWSLYAKREYKEAEQMHGEVLQLRKEHLGINDRDTLSSYSDLAWSLYAQGNYTEAENMHRTALKERETHLDAEHNDTLSSRSNLAWALYAQGQDRYQDAETEFSAATKGWLKVLPKDHWITLCALKDQAMVCLARSNIKGAVYYYGEVHRLQNDKWGRMHEDTKRARVDSQLFSIGPAVWLIDPNVEP